MTIAMIVVGILGLAGVVGLVLYVIRIQQQNMESRFRDLSLDVFQKQSELFLQLAEGKLQTESQQQKSELDRAKKEVETLLKPLQETLGKYQTDLQRREREQHSELGSLKEAIKSVMDMNLALKKETTQLSHALKRPSVRGRWGELQLRRIVELAGMSPYVDFDEQSSSTVADVSIRPDLIVRMPNQRQIIIDAKAPMDAYLAAEEANSDSERENALERHAQAVRMRISELSRKSYWDQFQQSPDFVVLFIPGEAFFSAALERDPSLVEKGFEQKVVLTTPTTLMSLLKAVAYGWKQEQVAENARQIQDQATKLLNGLSSWFRHLESMRGGLEKAGQSYNDAIGSLERVVMPQVRRMVELGASGKTPLAGPEVVSDSLRTSKLAEAKLVDEKLSEEKLTEAKFTEGSASKKDTPPETAS